MSMRHQRPKLYSQRNPEPESPRQSRLSAALRWIVDYLADPGFRRDLHCYGGLALLACGLSMLYGPAHALVAVGVLLFALPLVVGALSRGSS